MKFIKLTRFDNAPIWLNSAFVVTVEPRRQGGSTVVPVGDGLDYDVRESTDAVLAMLEEVPPPAVVPIPVPEMLTRRPDDVAAESVTMSVADVVELKGRPASSSEPLVDGKKRAPRKTASRKPRAKKVAAPLTEEQVERLKKMSPGSVKKLANTLATQFKAKDPDGAIRRLAELGVLSLDQDHVSWR